GHASIMQYQHVRLYAAPALAVVWRLSNLCDDAGFGLKLRHEQDHLRDHPLVGPAWTVRNVEGRNRRGGPAGICAGKRAGHKLPLELGLELSSELAKLLQARLTYEERRPESPEGRSGPPHRRGPAPSHYTDTATPLRDEAI